MKPVSVSAVGDGVLAVSLAGEIDYTNATQVLSTVREATTDRRFTAVRVDLSDVTFLDSSGVGVLVDLMKLAGRAGAEYRVQHPNAKVRDQLRITGLLRAFHLAESDER